ncbi:MAG: AraC family transcriptional regulator [Rhodobacteraceae bacterium]|nr:AraC family transcriptional regulator [Paracoccaceae bacterium]
MEEISIISLLELVALATATFLGLHFITSKDKSQKLLGNFLLLGFIFDFVFRLFFFLNIEIDFDFLPNTSYIYVPFLYFYALALTGQNDKKKWYLLSPAVLFYIGKILAIIFEIEAILFAEHFLAYPFSVYIGYLVLRVIHVHQKNIFHYFSSVEDKSLNWLRILTITLICFNLLWMIEDILHLLTDFNFFFPEISAIATIITIYWIGFSSLKQNIIFNDEIPLTESTTQKTLNESELMIFKELTQLMDSKQLYKNENLSLRDVANNLQCGDKQLSKIINTKTKNNFYHFINTYRVNCFKEYLYKSPQMNLTLFGLAQECGFKTKSTFYTAFKKVEGCTPNEFMQQI